MLEKYGIEFYVAVMVGMPGHTKKHLEAACAMARRSVAEFGAIAVSLHWIHPYPGTPFYDRHYSSCPLTHQWQQNPEYYTFVKPIFPMPDVYLQEMEAMALETLESANGTAIVNASSHIQKERKRTAC